MLLYTHAVWGLALTDFFGRDSWLSEGLVRAIAGRRILLLALVAGPPSMDLAGLRRLVGHPAPLHGRISDPS